MKERIDKKLKKGEKMKDYQRKLLSDCKSRHCQCTSVDELLQVSEMNPNRSEFIVKTKLSY